MAITARYHGHGLGPSNEEVSYSLVRLARGPLTEDPTKTAQERSGAFTVPDAPPSLDGDGNPI